MIKNLNLNRIFHDSSQIFHDKQCILRIAKESRQCISYGRVENIIKEIVTIFDECGISKQKNKFIGIIGDEMYIETVAALIAIMDIENAFVFLDVSSPLLIDVMDRLKVTWLLGEHSCLESLHLPLSTLLINVQKTFKVLENTFSIWKRTHENENFEDQYRFAFAVMSSGSTGEPKVIKVPHESIVPNVIDLREIYQLNSENVLYLSTPLTFDPSIVDIFLAFYSGASILLPSQDNKFDPEFLLKIFTEGDDCATVWYTTPSLFSRFAPKQIERSSLKILILGGEQFPSLNLVVWPYLEAVQIYNIYGISEVSCWASVHLIDDFNKPIPLGRVLSDTIFEMRNENLSDGIGELYIGSSRRKCIVNDDFNVCTHHQLFRATGDLVKVINGEYYYIGRKDRRIKLYGHIIDLSAIEATILRYHHVESCCCVFIHKENKIIAFIECKVNNCDLNGIEKFLKTELPSVMVPSKIFVHKIPIKKHGKICENSCRNLYAQMKASTTNISTEFRNLWAKYTTKGEIGDTLGFIDSGGNSIFALQFTTGLSELCEVPTDFIAFLLSNKSYAECLKLIETELHNKSENKPDEKFTSNNVKRITHEKTFEISKKLKKMFFGQVLQVKGKNYSQNGRNFEAIGSNQYFKINHLKINWKHDLEKCVDASPTLVVFENAAVVICGSHSGQLIMVEIQSGDIILKMRLPDRIESSAAISTCGKYFFIGCYDKKLYCINIPDNCIQWSYETGDIVKSNPVLRDNRLYFGSYDHNFYCISAETGTLIWRTNIDKSSIYATPIVNKSIIVVTLGGTVAILNHDGDITYSISFGKPFFSNPLQLLNREEFFVIDVTGVMRLLNMNTGSKIWEHRISGNVFSSITPIDSHRNRIVFGCHDKNVYCFEILTKAPNLVWKTELDSTIYSTPFAFGNHPPLGINSFDYRYIVATSTSGNIYIIDSNDGNCLLSCSNSGPIFSSPVVHDSCVVVGCRDNYLYCFEISRYRNGVIVGSKI